MSLCRNSHMRRNRLAARLIQLASLLPTVVQSHLLAAEVALRKGRLVVALGAVRKAAEVAEGGAAHPDVHVLVVRLALAGGCACMSAHAWQGLGPRRGARAAADETCDSCSTAGRGGPGCVIWLKRVR